MSVCWVCFASSLLGASPWSAAVRERARSMLAKLTQEEKLNMTWGRNKDYGTPTRPDVGNIPGVPAAGVPPTYLEDGPQGVGDRLQNVTNWPSQLTVAMTWDENLLFEWGKAMGREQYLKGTNVMLGPDVNMARVPWGGRVFEMMGEDPYHAARMARTLVKGIQTNNISACAKHYIFNSHECNRQSYSANVPTRAAHEIYLPPFLAAVDAGVGSIMCAFNRVNNTFSCENNATLNGFLKDPQQGGFRGWVVTDWGADFTTVGGANSGLDQEMQWARDGLFFGSGELGKAVANGSVPEARLDDMVMRMLEPMVALGLADDPPPPPGFSNSTPRNTKFEHARSAEHDALALVLAEESMVLLKNGPDESGNPPPLPLLQPSTSVETISVAFYGDNSTVHGTGSGQVYIADGLPVAPADALAQVIETLLPSTASVRYETWPEAAARYQVAVVVVGMQSGEGRDRANLSLPFGQDQLVRAVAAANPSTVVVVRCPGACLMPWSAHVPSILYQLMGGQAAGLALAKVLLGAGSEEEGTGAARGAVSGGFNPGGKLTVSFPTSEAATWLGGGAGADGDGDGDENHDQDVSSASGNAAGAGVAASSCPNVTGVNRAQYPGTIRDNAWAEADYSEDVLIGYRWYEEHVVKAKQPLFCFGHGLSYTTFDYSKLSVVGSVGAAGSANATIAVTLKNSGKVDAAEVVQLYLGQQGSPYGVKQLKGFKKIFLAAGASMEVTIPVSSESVSVWDPAQSGWVVSTGLFKVMVGSSSCDIRLVGMLKVG